MSYSIEALDRVNNTVNIVRLMRADWQRLCLGHERCVVQRQLLQLAESALYGTRQERLALLKGAHAVLPLHGKFLWELCRLLLDYAFPMPDQPPVPLEWCDVLIETLAHGASVAPIPASELLRALSGVLNREEKDMTPAQRLETLCLLRQIYGLGYRPQWVIEHPLLSNSS